MMVKDPLDEGRTLEIPFDGTNFTETPVTTEAVPEAEPEFKSTLSPGAAEAAQKSIRDRSFSGRNVHLGRMINCQVCGERHRERPTIPLSTHKIEGKSVFGGQGKVEILRKCEQNFTNVVDGYEIFREDPKTGTLVPYLRTAIDPELQPTPKQIMGAAAFAKRRRNPHLKAWKLQLIERTRAVFTDMGFKETEGEQAQKNMAIARKEAIRQIINERRAARVAKRNQSKHSRRINWRLANNGSTVRKAYRPQPGVLGRGDSENAGVVEQNSERGPGQEVVVRDGASGSGESSGE